MNERPASLGRRAPQQRRAAVMDAAQSLFIARGIAHTSIDAIAKEAGVAKGTVFLYFPTKEHLVQAIEADFNARIVKRTQMVAKEARGTATKIVEAWCVELIRSYLEELEIHDMLFYNGAAATREGIANNALIDNLEALLATLKIPEPSATAAFLVGGVTMLTDRAILENSADNPAELIEKARRIVAAAVRKPREEVYLQSP